MKRAPPYYPNPDGTECAQCVLRMGLEYFEGVAPTMAELYALTGKKPGKLTWHMRSYVELRRRGYDVIVYDPYDYAALVRGPEDFIRQNFSPSEAEAQIALSDLAAATEDARVLLASDTLVHRESYTADALHGWLDDGYLAWVYIDEAVNRGVTGAYWPHFILVFDHDAAGFIAHNPGGEMAEGRVPNQHLAYALFERANKINAG